MASFRSMEATGICSAQAAIRQSSMTSSAESLLFFSDFGTFVVNLQMHMPQGSYCCGVHAGLVFPARHQPLR